MTSVGVRRWAWLLVLLGGIVLYLIVLVAVADTRSPVFVPSLILLGAAVIPAAFLTFATGRTAGWQVSGAVLAGTALVGGVVGTVAAGWLEYGTLRRLSPAALFGVGLIEEAAKLIVPVAVLLLIWQRRGGTADGLLIGMASGMGFAVLETMGYAFVELVRSSGNIGMVEQLLLVRGLFSPAGHISWTGLTGAALWQFAARPTGRSGLALLGTYVAVVILHALWDGVGNVIGYLVIGAISIGWLLWRIRHTRVFQPLPSGSVMLDAG